MTGKKPGKSYLEGFNELIISLQTLYSANEAREISRRLVEHISEKPFTWLLAHPAAFFGLAKEKQWDKAVKRLLQGTPIQYVTGKSWFFGYPFKVNRSVLIPRPETEELVDWIIRDYQDRPGIRVLDACTGSGCIIITLARSLKIIAMAFDNSPEALEVAAENAENLDAQVDLREIDLLNALPEDYHKITVIACNPPYVTEADKSQMHPNVVHYEPGNALYVPDEDPLLYYKRISDLGRTWLVKGGKLYLEINEAFGPQTVALLQADGYEDVQLRKDIHGRDRMVRATKPGAEERKKGPEPEAGEPQEDEEGHME